jgi:hypothetical protein
VSGEEQERRFMARQEDPEKRWKLSPTDSEARARWVDYAEAKDQMFAYTDTKDSPWFVVEADDKRTARLNLISHLLEQIPYERVDHEPVGFPPRQERADVRPPIDTQTFVPELPGRVAAPPGSGGSGAPGVMSFQASRAVMLAISASRRSAGSCCTTRRGLAGHSQRHGIPGHRRAPFLDVKSSAVLSAWIRATGNGDS